jgi:flotillin
MLTFIAGQMVPLAVLTLVATVMGIAFVVARYRHNVAPNQVAIVSGMSRKAGDGKVGYRVVAGGGFFLLPVMERVDYLSLNVMTFSIELEDAPDKNGAPVSVRAIANVKVLSTQEALPLAIERFLGMNMDAIQRFAKENLESNLRAIVGTLTIEDLIRDRSALQSNVTREAVSDLAKLGLGVDLLNIQEVRDAQGYITALGQTKTAAVKRDAIIGKAEAERDAKVSAAAATQKGAIAEAQSAQAISDAQRDRDIVVARNASLTQAEQSRIAIAAKVAAADETSKLNVAEVAAQKARVKAETELQEFELQRKEAELQATVIVTASRERDAMVIEAEGQQAAASKIGEALRIKAEKEGQGEQARAFAVAEGRKATAAAVQAEREAEAAGNKAGLVAEAEGHRARLLAEAEGTRAKMLSEAEGTRAKLLAEAEGALKKAEAFKALDEAGRFLMIMEASPAAIQAIGQALASALTPVAGAIGTGLGNIDELRVVDMGGSNGGGQSLIQNMANIPVETIFGLIEKAKAAGFGPAVEALAARTGLTTSPPSKIG